MSPRNCCSALSPPAGSMGRINGKDCFQQNQWLTDGFRSGHHQPEGRWPREGVWAQEWEGRPTSRGSLNPLQQTPGRDPERGGKTQSICPLGTQHDPVWPVPWPIREHEGLLRLEGCRTQWPVHGRYPNHHSVSKGHQRCLPWKGDERLKGQTD